MRLDEGETKEKSLLKTLEISLGQGRRKQLRSMQKRSQHGKWPLVKFGITKAKDLNSAAWLTGWLIVEKLSLVEKSTDLGFCMMETSDDILDCCHVIICRFTARWMRAYNPFRN